jgi:aryl-alcohol dehydrogenase-like predicted oxidoreductase
LKRVEQLKTVCASHYSTLAEAAMRFVLSERQVSTLIPGMKNRAEVDMNLVYSDGVVFPSDLKKQLSDYGWVRNYYI